MTTEGAAGGSGPHPSRTRSVEQAGTPVSVDVLVIGAGQAGLSAAYHLARRGFEPLSRATLGDRTFLVVDDERGPGGAWRHRWDSLTMATVNNIYDLPGMPQEPVDNTASSREVLPD